MEVPEPTAVLAKRSTARDVPAARFSAALLKVASRCNLDCDYCYVYHHIDQSWRTQPKLMSAKTLDLFADRLREYVLETEIDTFSVIFHGGEPLLYTAAGLAKAAAVIRSRIPPSCQIDFSLQTNGVLLSEAAITKLAEADISISLSLDGPREAHDRHRLDHGGRSTFEATMGALDRLRQSSAELFRGVIAVIDPAVPPEDLFEFFAPLDLPRLDFLLPDATHVAPPPGRNSDPLLYQRWLERAFELWFESYPTVPIRWFDAVLASRVGVPSPTDVMGFGAVSLLVVETDGTYSDHDVFKVTAEQGGSLGASLQNASFTEIARHPAITDHGRRLQFEGISQECRACPVVEACGGGAVMHRAHATRGLDAPTVYCKEMFSLLEQATCLIRSSLSDPNAPAHEEEHFPFRGRALVHRCTAWRAETETEADRVANASGVERGTSSAAAVLLPVAYGFAPSPVVPASEPAGAGRWMNLIRLQSSDPRLSAPFLDTIRVLPNGSPALQYALAMLPQVEVHLRALDADLPEALAALISDIIFVESSVPDEGGIFSFSDDKAPNVLYIAPFAGGQAIPPEDLADSLYHEFLHQVLYHYERGGALLFDSVHPRFPAPWRPGLRPSGGFLHGTFVFAGLSRLWDALSRSEGAALLQEKARRNAARAKAQAIYGLGSLQQFALLTPRGEQLVVDIAAHLGEEDFRLRAPGVID